MVAKNTAHPPSPASALAGMFFLGTHPSSAEITSLVHGPAQSPYCSKLSLIAPPKHPSRPCDRAAFEGTGVSRWGQSSGTLSSMHASHMPALPNFLSPGAWCGQGSTLPSPACLPLLPPPPPGPSFLSHRLCLEPPKASLLGRTPAVSLEAGAQ